MSRHDVIACVLEGYRRELAEALENMEATVAEARLCVSDPTPRSLARLIAHGELTLLRARRYWQARHTACEAKKKEAV